MSTVMKVLENGSVPNASGEWGFAATNPIPLANEADGATYLCRLAIEGDNRGIALEYFGCVNVASIDARVSVYEVFDLETGRNLCDLHFLSDCERTVWEAPKGFYLRDCEEPAEIIDLIR